MVFSSIQAYLDPANWQQQLNHQIGVSSGPNSHPQLQPPPPPPPPPPQQQQQLLQQHQQQHQQQLLQTPPPPPPHGSGGPGSIRPGSMSDRARMANIPMPEVALKCPRCDSTNTKFCYFNNYSLSQPRHFCKTCRRYWTRNGALRNVPVGGGCRRNNKRSKGSSNNSKSPASSGDRQAAPSTGSGTSSMNLSSSTTSGISANILGLTSQIPQLRFMSPLSQLTHDFGSNDIGLNYGGNSAPAVASSEMNFHIGSNLFGGSGGGAGSASVLYPFQGQQFPFLGGLDQSGQGLFSYGGGEPSGYVGAKLSNSMLSQLASVKMEDHNINNRDQSNNLARQFMGVNPGNNDQWSGSAWTDLSGFSSSSTSNPL